MATKATDEGKFRLQEPLSRAADRCVNRFAEGQIGAWDKMRQRAHCSPLEWALNGSPKGFGFLWGKGARPGLGSGEQPSQVGAMVFSGNIQRRDLE